MEWRSRWGDEGAVKALLLYCRTPVLRVLRIEYKETAVYSNGGFFVLENFVGERDSANAKPYKHTDDCSTKSEWDSADFEMGCVGRGAVSDNNTKAVTV